MKVAPAVAKVLGVAVAAMIGHDNQGCCSGRCGRGITGKTDIADVENSDVPFY